jgi:hypothetical protein
MSRYVYNQPGEVVAKWGGQMEKMEMTSAMEERRRGAVTVTPLNRLDLRK